jgi:chitinase
MTPRLLLLAFLLVVGNVAVNAQRLAVIGYYAGRPTGIDSFPTEKLTHVIFSFCHLKGNRLDANNIRDTTTIQKLVALKAKHPQLKVILSLGGWGGCRTCTDAFSTDSGRREFAQSAREMSDYFHTDGIDLDWEYPALANVPEYSYKPEDRDNFTAVVRVLRKTLDRKAEISFAAGGFTDYLRTSIDWKAVAPLVDYINVMSYDLVNGYSTETGHHTGLYSTPQQVESTDHAVRWLDSAGVPLRKVVIGMAFYVRIFQGVDPVNNGLYRPGRFYRGVPWRDQAVRLSVDSGWAYHWDPVAQAPYKYNAKEQLFATYDDTTSIRLKTVYALRKKLGGVMFWQLTEDNFFSGGLLDVIDNAKMTNIKGRKN